MLYRIQKTIFAKYLHLTHKEAVSEIDIKELLDTIKDLYKNKVLTPSDIFYQKIELISSHLEETLNAIKRKRIHKLVSLDISKDFIKILKDDIDGVDYHKTDLEALKDFETQESLDINLNNTIEVLKNLIIPKRKLSAEQDLEKFIYDRLCIVFGKEKVYRQYSIGGFLALKSDIDLGNGKVGLELKVANNLSATDMQRIIGQVTYYKNRFYGDNLSVFLASKTDISPTIRELIEFIEEIGITVIYTKAI